MELSRESASKKRMEQKFQNLKYYIGNESRLNTEEERASQLKGNSIKSVKP